jgi:hypothetical protein
MKPLRIADQNVRHSEAICEVGENWQRTTGGPPAQEPGMGDRGIILIVTGVSGSKKSTVAMNLAQQLGWAFKSPIAVSLETSVITFYADAARRTETGLAGWACWIRTGESVGELSD